MKTHSYHIIHALFCCIILGGTALPRTAHGEDELLALSLEELMNIEVTGLSKKEDTFSTLPAAAYVITSQDIRRSTATTIPELLKIVPGVNVSQISSGRYAVSSRGFNSLFSNKLLVLIDGKESYSSLFSSANWDTMDIPMEDIERIEIYRGPAGTIYGSNAVNGIINIITKESSESSGTYLAGRSGNFERAGVDVRHGGSLSEDFDYRLSGNYRNKKRFNTPGGSLASNTGDESFHGALRLDGKISEKTQLTSHVRFSATQLGDVFTFNSPLTPGGITNASQVTDQYNFYITQRLEHSVNDHLSLVGQFFFDREDRESLDIKTTVNTVNAEGRAIWNMSHSLDLITGATYRHSAADLNDGSTLNVTFSDKNPSLDIGSLFGQLEYAPSDTLKLYGGIRLEHNDYTNLEYMPNLRAAYSPDNKNTLWASIGRATRLPSIIDENGTATRFNGDTDPSTGLPLLVNFGRGDDSKAETLLAYELGYRGTLSSSATLDISTFYYDYSNLQGIVPGSTPSFSPGPPPAIAVPTIFDYNASASAWGFEAGSHYTLSDSASIFASYSYLNLNTTGFGSFGSAFNQTGADPESKVTVAVQTSPMAGMNFDLYYYFYDHLTNYADVSSYHQIDAKLSYNLSEHVRVSAVGKNLTNSNHFEWGTEPVILVQGGEVPRSYYGVVEIALD